MLQKADKRGRTPLHYGMWRQAPVDVIEIVIEANGEAADLTDTDGKTPVENEKGPRPK